jgi:DNA polymerase I-like protein with 3'-5' exonuclease and polymerase domains
MPYYKDEGKVWEKGYGEKQFWEYCCKDCTATYQTRNGIAEELTEMGLSPFYHDYVKPLSWVLQDLQFTGVLVDEDRKLSMAEANTRQVARLQTIIDASVDRATAGNITSLNVKSNPQMKEFLYGFLKLPFQHTGTGPKRRVTTDEDAIVSLKKEAKGRTDFFDIILKIRELRKENEFLATPVHNGRMNTSLVASGTETGRLASRADAFDRGTNLQNVKHKLRAIFVPDPGFELWEVDGSQAEARVVAVLAQQWDLVELFERGDIDVHWENAKRIFGLHGALLYDYSNTEHYRMRYLAKRIIHASNYGMSWFKFRQLLLAEAGIDMSKPEVEALLAAYHQLYPNIEGVFHQGIIKQLRQNRTITTPYGRVRVFHDRWPKTGVGELFRKAYAYVPQSTIGDLINRALLDFHTWCKGTLGRAQVLTQVHDSILYQVKPAMEVAARAKIKELMERPIDFGYHKLIIPADFKRGMNWGDYDDKENPLGMKEAA